MSTHIDGHVVVVDLGFGDAGKGATVDRLCAQHPTGAVVRFNGGAQAAHRVVAGDREHVFRQFGSGSLTGTRTLLAGTVAVEPIDLAREADELSALGVADPFALLSVHRDALLTTPIHAATNRAREDARGTGRHGSCGLGIGETVAWSLTHDAPRVADCTEPDLLRRKLDALARACAPVIADSGHHHPSVADLVDLYREFAATVRIVGDEEEARLATYGRLVFEGAQGVLLDEWHGFHPHTTWSTVTPDHALAVLRGIGAGLEDVTVLGVTRSYQTRHGAGPFPSEDSTRADRFPEAANGTGRYQGGFRTGALDPLLLRYAIRACGGVDGLALTHLDRIDTGIDVVTAHLVDDQRLVDIAGPFPVDPEYVQQSALTAQLQRTRVELAAAPTDPAAFTALVAAELGTPVLMAAAGPDRSDITDTTTVPAA
ncbi:adenylosuccinate synthetase [Nakamurella sp. YIM 132087]|uniref:Adenylosuccinate synthetase n=1 Tax=Nakamurella alba TaxID=2665158 RepID=A0A7K1FRG2_9ACTN|nr:adenylosuccinate synthetase [Nakamurella alba]MTD15394.1 adenylosuccinate synthetase [Nakamurella alba]